MGPFISKFLHNELTCSHNKGVGVKNCICQEIFHLTHKLKVTYNPHQEIICIIPVTSSSKIINTVL